MKKASDYLFRLIHSLSQSEQRYFKLFARRHVSRRENKYVRIFDIVAGQKQYDEEPLRKFFPGRNASAGLFAAKDYLFKMILRSLEVHHARNTVHSTLKNQLTHIEVLYRKGLYKICARILSQAKEEAYRFEDFYAVMQLLGWERTLMITTADLPSLEENEARIFSEELSIIKKTENINAYQHLHSQVIIISFKEGHVRKEKEIKKLRSIMDHPLLSDERQALSYSAKLSYYRIYASYFYTIADRDKYYRYLKKQMILMESHPHQIKEQQGNYLRLLNNFIPACIMTAHYREAEAGLQKFKNITGADKEVKAYIFINTHSNELDLSFSRGEYKKALSIIPAIEKGLQQFNNHSSRERLLILYFDIFYVYFALEDYSRALKWINRILNERHIGLREDLYANARMMNLVVHFELGNTDLLEYIVRSTYRYLYKRDRLYRFETALLNFIRRKLPGILNRDELIKAFKILKEELQEIIKDSSEQKALEYFDFISWLESKVEGKPFAEIVRRKYHNLLLRKPAGARGMP